MTHLPRVWTHGSDELHNINIYVTERLSLAVVVLDIHRPLYNYVRLMSVYILILHFTMAIHQHIKKKVTVVCLYNTS